MIIGCLATKTRLKKLEDTCINVSSFISAIKNFLVTNQRDEQISKAERKDQIKKNIDEIEIQLKGIVSIILSFIASMRMLGWIAGLVAACGSVALFSISYMQVQRLDSQIKLLRDQNKIVNAQNVLIESERRSSLNTELTSIFESIEKFLDENDATEVEYIKLSKLLIGRISALSRVLKPYKMIGENGLLTDTPISPERGHLLLVLTNLKVDMRPILDLGADFSNAELDATKLGKLVLVKANLDNINFQGFRVNEADLSESSFINANLSKAYFKKTNFKKAILENAILDKIVIHHSDLSEVILRSASLKGANISHSNLTDADLRSSKLNGAFLRHATLPTSDKFRGADVTGVDFQGARIPSEEWVTQMSKEGFVRGFVQEKWEIVTIEITIDGAKEYRLYNPEDDAD